MGEKLNNPVVGIIRKARENIFEIHEGLNVTTLDGRDQSVNDAKKAMVAMGDGVQYINRMAEITG